MRIAPAILALCVVVPAGFAAAQSRSDRLSAPGRRPSNTPERPRSTPSPPGLPDWDPSPSVPVPPARWGSVPGTPPDVVLLRDGGMLRGTIVRSDPGGEVEIVLVTGDMHRVGWGEVRSAGRAEDAPLSPQAGGAREPLGRRTVRLRFEANARLTLHRVGGTATMTASHGWRTVHGRADYFERECTSPCELELDPGVHHFGLSIGGSSPVHTGALDITGPGTLRGAHVDNAGIRAVGGVIMALGLAAAAVIVPLSITSSGFGTDMGWFITGCAAGGVGLLVGIPMLATHSGVTLRFE